jgi:hypothetical protein
MIRLFQGLSCKRTWLKTDTMNLDAAVRAMWELDGQVTVWIEIDSVKVTQSELPLEPACDEVRDGPVFGL